MSTSEPQPVPTPVGVLRHYWRVAEARWWHLAFPALLILITGAFDAASIGLLIPIADAMAANSYDVLQTSTAFGWLLNLVPASMEGSPNRDLYLTAIIISLVIAARFGKSLFEYLRKLYSVDRNERYRVAVGNETFGRVLGFGRQYFDRQSIGRIDAEIGWSSSVLALVSASEEVLRYLVGLVAKAIAMVALSVPLSIAFVVTLPFVSWFMNAINRRVKRISAQGVEVDRRLRSRILDILGSIPLVKAYSQEKAASETYKEVLHEAEDVAVRRGRVISLRYPVEEIVILVVMVLAQGTVIWLQGDFTPGDLATFGVFLLALQQALPDYKYLSEFSLKVAEEIPRLEAVAGLFSDEGKFIVPSGPRTFEKLREAIHVRDLTFQYQDGVDTLKDVDATIAAGKVTAIVGRTGAGKTTFVDLIARFYDCAPGTIMLDDVDIREYSLASLHARMAIVSQDVWLLNRTLRDNLTFGLDRPADDVELTAALADVDLGDFLGGLHDGLDTEIGDRGVRLSGGQRQRVALARALLRDPDILILDEATSALDSVVEQRVARAIQQRARGRTLIIIAHRLSTIRNSDLILVMHEGKLVEQGSWEELVRKEGAFYELYRAQFSADEEAVRT